MNYRYAEVMGDVNLGDVGTKVIDIKILDPVSRFVVKFRPVGGSVTGIAHPVVALKKIELVDGSDVLYSLTGMQGHAINQIEAVNPIATIIDYRVGSTPLIDVNLDFGRFLMDPELAFVPTNFKNPQLKITWDEDLWDESADSHSMAVWAYAFDEKAITPTGFLLNKEIKSFVAVNGANEYTDIPTDYPLRMLIIQALKTICPPRTMCSAIKLSEDNDKRIPIDGDTYKLEPLLMHWSGECEDRLTAQGNIATADFYVTPSYNCTAGFIGRGTATYGRMSQQGGGVVRIGTLADTTNFVARIKGYFPHGCLPIKFGDQLDINDWYDVTKLGSLLLTTKGEAGCVATDIARIVTQQLRTY